jgi:hypothetical protein
MQREPDHCLFCGRTDQPLAVSQGALADGTHYTGALCLGCIRTFILDMAWTDPDEFNKMVAEARNPNRH